jgi:hypothetical protein
VPVDQLLPQDDGPVLRRRAHRAPEGAGKLAIDLEKLEDDDGGEFAMLEPVPALIQVQRQDFNGRVITIRHDDLKALACILDLGPEQVAGRLDDLGLRYVNR